MTRLTTAKIRAAITATDGNVTAAAKALGVSRQTVYKWMRREDDKAEAYAVVREARKQGLLIPSKCERCGGEPVHAHHPNGYGVPHQLDIEWLCASCHGCVHFYGPDRPTFNQRRSEAA